MGDIISLRKARKAAAREQKEAEAARNRQRHGVSKALRSLGQARSAKADRELQGHRIDGGKVE